jgi:glycosyltransferase involved in cell wall biosynthesis
MTISEGVMFKPRSIHIIDPGLVDVGGHNHTQDFSIARECQKRGIPVAVYCRHGANLGVSDVNVIETFRFDIFAEVQQARSEFVVFENYFLLNRVFLQDLNSLASSSFSSDDLVYFPNIMQNQIEAVADWLVGLPVPNRPYLALTLRYLNSKILYNVDRGYGPGIEFLYRHVLPKLMERHPRTSLFSDTQVLSSAYSLMAGVQVITLPIPQLKFGSNCDQKRADGTRSLSILYIGGWAQYHGSDYIPEVIRSVLSDFPNVNFTIRIKDGAPDSERARPMLTISEAFSPRVKLLFGHLSPDEYIGTMQSADIVLLLYLPSHYSFASSGVFAEAAALGKVLVATAGTTMEASINTYDLGAVIVPEFTAELCAATVKNAIANFAELDKKASASYVRFSRENSPEGFLDQMFSCIR